MFIDSSAVVEILINGEKVDELLGRIAANPVLYSGPTVVYEAAAVLTTRLGREPEETKRLVEQFIEQFGIQILNASLETAPAAIDAFSRYGKGRHPAKLNFGDCFSYAGAKIAGVPLLYIGGDFALTDLG